MKRGTKILVFSLLGIALAFFVYVLTQLESKQVTREGEFSGQARINPLLAAERMLTELGVPAEGTGNLDQLPPLDHTLILSTSGITLEARGARDLVDWVSAGGNLVLMLPSEGGLRRLLAEDLEEGYDGAAFWSVFGLELDLNDGWDFDEESTLLDLLDEFETDSELEPDSEFVELESGRVEAQLESPFLIYESEALIGDRVGDLDSEALVQVQLGEGLVTAVATDRWASSEEIADLDHARLFWELATAPEYLTRQRAGARIIYSEATPGLMELLFEHGRALLLSGAILLIFWLWVRGSRFGPPMPDPPRARRDFSEHIEASGEYLWRNEAAAQLVEAPRRELRRRIANTRPSWARVPDEELADELATLSSLDSNEVLEALSATTLPNSNTFTRVVKNISVLRQSL